MSRLLFVLSMVAAMAIAPVSAMAQRPRGGGGGFRPPVGGGGFRPPVGGGGFRPPVGGGGFRPPVGTYYYGSGYEGYYVQPQYVQPQYVQPQYVQPQYVQPQYVQPQYVQPQYPVGPPLVPEPTLIPDQQTGPVAPPVNSLPTITTPPASRSTPLVPNVLPQVNQVKPTVTPKVNKVGRQIAKAGPGTRWNAALRANTEVIDRTRELKKVADKAGLGPGKPRSKILMDRPLKQTKEVSVTLCSYDPKAELSRDVDGEPLGAQDAIFGDLKQKGYLTDADKQDFDTKYGKGDWAGIEKLLATKNVPPDLRNVYMKQIELAQRFNRYNDAAMTGAEGGQLAYLKGQFDAAAKDYNDAVQKAANLGLLKPEDFAERLLAIDDISKRMDTINQYAKVRDLCTQPFSPDPSGGLTLSGGPVMIFTDPDPSLPGGMMTQLGTDLVAIGTGGQGEPLVQVGSPSDVGYPLITNVRPVPEASPVVVERPSDQALVIINPATTRATVNFKVDQTPYRLEAGLAQSLIGQTFWVIAFDSGGQAGEVSYTLAPGGYSFTVKASGWDLVQKTFKVTLDNSANPEDFNYVLDNQAGVVTARQAQEITRKLPIVLAFDRGDGREVAHKELAEGTYAIGIDPQTRLLELFPGRAAVNAPTSVLF